MIDSRAGREIATDLAATWNARRVYDVPCRTVVVVAPPVAEPCFGYVSAVSDVERILGPASEVLDVGDLDELAPDEAYDRLTRGEVIAYVGSREVIAGEPSGSVPVPFDARRQDVRAVSNEMRFLLRQYAVEEIAAHRGARPELLQAIRAAWSSDLAITLDVAMQLSLGADRQRYTDRRFTDRMRLRLPAAYQRLARSGVRSNPLLVLE